MTTPRPRNQLPFQWPDPPFNIVLVEPDIPQNTGNIARLCAATGTTLNLVEPLGFQLTDKLVKRAGLDYWDSVDVRKFPNLGTFMEKNSKARARPQGGRPRECEATTERSGKFYFSTNGAKNYTEADYQPGDCLIFGSESKGLPLELLEANPDDVYNIPIQLDHVRSLNLANAASIVLYEALRQANCETK
ncbi:MAG: tRNA (cytidine(34)-2'-O)-methyltransferase [Kiritimatiellales bacterium]|nr:tRNA (cytidine(34)-2'-O)-methyltransferase [Kiritimatiellota bacterium]MBL7017244.1 tRNA (cytidine(34)-2'-O)-methyltransferase [Kiritimatiellales bacterium]